MWLLWPLGVGWDVVKREPEDLGRGRVTDNSLVFQVGVDLPRGYYS